MQNFIVHQMVDILKISTGKINSFELIITEKILHVDSISISFLCLLKYGANPQKSVFGVISLLMLIDSLSKSSLSSPSGHL